jgi:cytochrome c556
MLNKARILFVALAVVAVPVFGQTGDTTLKAIMQEMRLNLLDITDGFLLDDFEKIAEGALAIAEHPGIPPEQVRQVAEELGAEMPVFRNFDVQVHELSLEAYKAAREQDRAAAVAAYQGMVAACFDCHAAFRQRVADILSEK